MQSWCWGEDQKFQLLYNIIKHDQPERILIFTNRRDQAERLSDDLERYSHKCEMLSGAVTQKKRMRILEDFKSGKVKGLLVTSGKRIAEESCSENMFEVLMLISRTIGAQVDLPKKTTQINIYEGTSDDFPEKSINQLLPGDLSCRVPEDTIINIFKQLQSMETFKTEDPYEAAKFVKGRFKPMDESDINFFKWRECTYLYRLCSTCFYARL